MEEFVPFGSNDYYALLALLLFARGMDFLSTWLATPSLMLEANPIAKRLGWRPALILNAVICLFFAKWPLPAIVVSTSSILVAARNFQSAWLMRSMGEYGYRQWMADRLREGDFGVYVWCLIAQTALTALVGIGLMYFSGLLLVPFAVGLGIVTYAMAVFTFTFLAIYRLRRSP